MICCDHNLQSGNQLQGYVVHRTAGFFIDLFNTIILRFWDDKMWHLFSLGMEVFEEGPGT
jgi:hypothetical protein